MKISDCLQFEYDCRDTQELLTLLIVCPEELSMDERKETRRHLSVCSGCREDYEGIKFASDMLCANRDYLRASGVFGSDPTDLQQVDYSEKELVKQRFEAMMDRELARCKRRQQRERIAKVRRIARPISAVAACLLIALGIWGILTNNNPAEIPYYEPAAARPSETPVKIELFTYPGTEIIQAGQLITASSDLKTLRINDNRQMILNSGTELSIFPHNLGCIIKLDKGEIYAEVVHDGKSFIVETAHGRAVITGTTFNIKTDDRQMQLAVVEGTVRFENDKGFVNVTAGHKSRLALNSEPALPVECDTIKLTAWARVPDRIHEVAVKDYQPEIELSSAFGCGQIDLECIDYDRWIEQKRYWFKREFPHIFRFKEALAREGIEVDYPELLINSGDLRRFAYPEQTRTRLVPVSYESMIKLVSAYNKNEQWLDDNLKTNLTSEKEPSVQKSFDRWLGALEESSDSTSEISSELLTYSLHAGMYLYKTRTLLWLALNNDWITLKAIEKKKTAALLEQQIKAANNCVAKFKEMFACGYSPDICRCGKPHQLFQGVIDNIEEIKEIEKKIAEYETFSK